MSVVLQQIYCWDMGVDSLVGCVCRHDQNPCPWREFDNIVKTWKYEQIYYILKNEQVNKFIIILMYIRFLFGPDLLKDIKKFTYLWALLKWKKGNLHFKENTINQ